MNDKQSETAQDIAKVGFVLLGGFGAILIGGMVLAEIFDFLGH